ncbi:MAG: bifunctional oligoribonuclease/PAP phosphatase NrnA [Christensenellaceae bacterium]|nr:bifunctional oligoribonuclease/PAP phosphatase NrnA [Christensenellaceae bacterium]
MKKILQELKKNNHFLIISHLSPDGDTLGSAAALCLALRSMGKKADCVVEGLIPKKLGFLLVHTAFITDKNMIGDDYDCAVAVDTATYARLGHFGEVFSAIPMRINIDHHVTNERYGMLNYVEDRAAVGEIMLDFIKQLGCKIDVPIANALYAAISTDTGNFQYSNTSEQTLLAAAELRKCGAEIPKLCDEIYNRRSFAATKLIGKALGHLNLYHEGKMAVLHMTLAEIAECGASRTDCDILVNYAREIETVEIAGFINEMPDGKFKVSFRSKNYADVAAFAGEYGGGGHVRAAGCVFEGPIDRIERIIVEKAKEYLK